MSASIGRRRFLGAAGLGLAAASGCGGPAAPSALPGATATAGSSPPPKAWSWEIRYIGGTPKIDGAAWRLRVDGLVDRPFELSLDELRALPRTEFRARMKCVECWSGAALWQGAAGADLMAVAKALPAATHLRLVAVEDYDTTLPLALVTAPRTLFVYAMDGAPLPPDNGFPLRLLVPSQYGYKNIKGIVRLELTDRAIPGFWERAGYSDDGTIRAGTDHPLDLGGTQPIKGGEIVEY